MSPYVFKDQIPGAKEPCVCGKEILVSDMRCVHCQRPRWAIEKERLRRAADDQNTKKP